MAGRDTNGKQAVDFKGVPITGYRNWVFQNDDGEQYPQRGVGLTADISARFADAATEFIRSQPKKPFFLHVNFTAPHDPLIMPPGYENTYQPGAMPLPANFLPKHPFDHGNLTGRDEQLLPWPRPAPLVHAVTAVYYAVVSHMDAQIGRIMAALRETRQLDNTIVIFTSDHGIALGSHGLRGKQNMYEHTIGVPLIFYGRGIPRGGQRHAQVYLRDLFPTACALAALEPPPTADGKSLVRVLNGTQTQVYPFVVGYYRDKQRMLRTRQWKLIHYPQIARTQLFDLRADPQEMHDLAQSPAHAATKACLLGQLSAWQRAAGDPLASTHDAP
jgi:arylsulfatase A-like enzyme